MTISQFWAENGPFHTTTRNNKGVLRAFRAQKRAEAEVRQAIERTYTDPIKKERARLEAEEIDPSDDPFNGMTVGDFFEQVDRFRKGEFL